MLDRLDLDLGKHFARDATGEREDRAATGLAGGAWMIGAAFAPQLDQSVTLEVFAAPETGWGRVAVELLMAPDAVAEKGTCRTVPGGRHRIRVVRGAPRRAADLSPNVARVRRRGPRARLRRRRRGRVVALGTPASRSERPRGPADGRIVAEPWPVEA